jgi:hypothetical protein
MFPVFSRGEKMGTFRVPLLALIITITAVVAPHSPSAAQGVRIEVRPAFMAGEHGGLEGDSPSARVDPNTLSSAFAGVGSLELKFSWEPRSAPARSSPRGT